MTEINYWRYQDVTAEQLQTIYRRAEAEIKDVTDRVKPILEDVRVRGDEALAGYAMKFEGADISGAIKATDEDFEQAYAMLDPEVIEALKVCIENVRVHHKQQLERVEWQWLEEVRPGQYAGEKVTPIPSVGLYVPRGKGSFPSMLYMLCVPAVLAGVKEIAVCTPPTPEGGLDAATLVAADLCGVRNVYKAGGAQAIAALAYGTETVPQVVQVSGPGSPYVGAAKRLLGDLINPGMPAGPSDALILADEAADSWNTALDVINEQEHGDDSATVLVTTSEKLAEAVLGYLPEIIESLSAERSEACRKGLAKYGGIMLCENMEEALVFANNYAAEHLLLKVKDPNDILPRIDHAAEILIGETTPSTLGNFGIGVNAVLPTGQKAMSYDCTSVWSFLKRTSLSYLTPEAYQRLKGPVTTLAHYEGFDGHAKVLEERNEDAFSEILLNLKK